jgi:hypothetical protein
MTNWYVFLSIQLYNYDIGLCMSSTKKLIVDMAISNEKLVHM